MLKSRLSRGESQKGSIYLRPKGTIKRIKKSHIIHIFNKFISLYRQILSKEIAKNGHETLHFSLPRTTGLETEIVLSFAVSERLVKSSASHIDCITLYCLDRFIWVFLLRAGAFNSV